MTLREWQREAHSAGVEEKEGRVASRHETRVAQRNVNEFTHHEAYIVNHRLRMQGDET